MRSGLLNCRGSRVPVPNTHPVSRKMFSPSVLILCLAGTISFFGGVHSGAIRINGQGGYENIIVSIGKDVPPIACSQIIQNIQGVITSASAYLRQATKGRLYFHRVIIVVPQSWDTQACGRTLPVGSYTSKSSLHDAAIRIGTEHPVFGHLPWTQQSRGCGQPGDFISVGYQYILKFNETENIIPNGGNGKSWKDSGKNQQRNENYPKYTHDRENGRNEGKNNNNDNLDDFRFDSVPQERAFVQEWAKFRYGIFSEQGFYGDAIYPLHFNEDGERRLTSCTNSPVKAHWSPGCDESSHLKNTSCRVSGLSSLENDRITSSIMSFASLKNVHLFCDESSHDSKAPTKHNFLCEGKSTSEVIYGHPDFQNLPFRDLSTPVPPPEFVVKQIAQPRFVLLVEETGNMNLRDVWKFLKLAVRKFLKYDLQTGIEIGMISVSTSEVRELANMTSLQSLSLRRALADKLPNYPNVDSGGNISLRRGIFQAVEMLKRNGGRAAGSVIILISQGTVSTTDLESSLDLMKREEVTVAAIEYPSLGDGKIATLAEETNGPHFAIREKGVGPTTHMSTFVKLINALMTIQTFFTKDVSATWPVMVHQAEYKGDSRSYVEANFSFESSTVQSPAEFFIYTSNPNDPKINRVELISPNGVKYTTQLSDLHDINVIKIDAVINEPGVWRYRMERLADSHQSHFVQVVTKTSSDDLSARLYTNVFEAGKVANLTETPLIIYAEVKYKKNSPVIDAEVEAIVRGGNKKWTVRLLDNGNGDPDVTKGDGVYSRYFIVPPGIVTITQLDISARVITNPYRARFLKPLVSRSTEHLSEPCCGSAMTPWDPKSQYKIVSFGERTTNRVAIRVTSIPPAGYYTPNRIGDLKLESVDTYDGARNATLSWTAVGEDMDQGVGASYEIFYSLDSRHQNWAMLAEKKADLESGVTDNVTITLPYYGSFMIAIRGVDFYGKWGKMSNIVRVLVLEPPSESEHTYRPEGGNTLSIKNTTPSLPGKNFTTFDLMLIILCGVGFVLLLAGMIVVVLYCRKVGHQVTSKDKKSGENTKISAITDPKSPIHWSASELLGEHEKGHSFYGGSSGNSPSQSEHRLHHNNTGSHHHHGTKGGDECTSSYGSSSQPPMSLNIAPTEYTDSTKSRGSPDSYDDPDCPTPIPVSVRHTMRPVSGGNVHHAHDFSVCVDGSGMRGQIFHPQQQQQQLHHHSSIQGYPGAVPNGGLIVPPQHGGYGGPHTNPVCNDLSSSSGSSMNRFSTANTISPVPPPPSHMKHYDPDVQGSLNSVNSKKRNITMV